MARVAGAGAGRRLSDRTFAAILLLPALALFALIDLYPLLYSIYVGFTDTSLLSGQGKYVGLTNLRRVLGEDFLADLMRTVAFAGGGTLLAFGLALGLALLLNAGLRGQRWLRGLVLLPWLLPGVVVSFLWLWMLDPNHGIVNDVLQRLGVVDDPVHWLGTPASAMASVIVAKSWHSFPWMAVMILAGLQTVPAETIDAARVDGAGAIGRFRHVVAPHLRPIFALAVLLELIWNFQHFDTIYVMTHGGPAGATTTFAVDVYDQAFQAYDLGRAGAIGLVWTVLLSAIVIVYIRADQRRAAP
ncbi:MAG: carbohydrate ABC transporter permease [Micromonosporaceae bacterium]